MIATYLGPPPPSLSNKKRNPRLPTQIHGTKSRASQKRPPLSSPPSFRRLFFVFSPKLTALFLSPSSLFARRPKSHVHPYQRSHYYHPTAQTRSPLTPRHVKPRFRPDRLWPVRSNRSRSIHRTPRAINPPHIDRRAAKGALRIPTWLSLFGPFSPSGVCPPIARCCLLANLPPSPVFLPLFIPSSTGGHGIGREES
ncbi:hypothetical protein B296_00017245 [Ensete ventricosum]|uniref:Uncharacterized protein n=1 Tax=Ensete ventricosum TaxID=4639 RepID=A0A426Z9P7_ENSVE|nr:hypothetical protein B296_00017245 [Ensete ventricosum]